MFVGTVDVFLRDELKSKGQVTYHAFLNNLNARGLFRIRPSLDRISRVLNVLGNPEGQWPSIHIAGTNGKGSVAASLESVLRANGYRTGLYTSPHLVDLHERIQINGKPVTHHFLGAAIQVMEAEKKAGTSLTYFELLTAIAFQLFTQMKVDIAIVECGLGGLWDATNLLPHPLVSLITSIGLDHRQWLGSTEKQIAQQKAGIIKTHGYVISGARGAGQKVIAAVAREKDATLVQLGKDFTSEGLTASWQSGKQTLCYHFRDEAPEIVPFGLLGRHQLDNAALVLTALRHLKHLGWKMASRRRDQALQNVAWPGRMQTLYSSAGTPILLDGAHNPPAVRALLDSIECSKFRKYHKTFIFSAFKDKDYAAMARMIASSASEIWLCPLPKPRGLSVSALRASFGKTSIPIRTFASPEAAIKAAKEITVEGRMIVVCGSLSLIGIGLSVLGDKSISKASKKELAYA